MPCGPYHEAKFCREKVGPTSIRSSKRALKRHIVRRIFSRNDAGESGQGKNIPYRQKTTPIVHDARQKVSGTDYVRFKIWRSATRTECWRSGCRTKTGGLCTGFPFPMGK